MMDKVVSPSDIVSTVDAYVKSNNPNPLSFKILFDGNLYSAMYSLRDNKVYLWHHSTGDSLGCFPVNGLTDIVVKSQLEMSLSGKYPCMKCGEWHEPKEFAFKFFAGYCCEECDKKHPEIRKEMLDAYRNLD